MWQWTKRVGGGVISFGAVWAAIRFVHSLPGFMDDSTIWYSLGQTMSLGLSLWVGTGVAGGVCFAGLALATSEWWWSRLLQWWKPAQLSPTVLAQPPKDLARFRACLPHIEQCRKLVNPFAGPLGSIDMAVQLLSDGGSRIQQLIQELGYLSRELKTLGIRCPIVYGANDESDSEFRIRLRGWSMYLTELEVTMRHEDLAGARQIIPIEMATQPNSDTE